MADDGLLQQLGTSVLDIMAAGSPTRKAHRVIDSASKCLPSVQARGSSWMVRRVWQERSGGMGFAMPQALVGQTAILYGGFPQWAP